MSALKAKGIYMLDPESAGGYSVVAAIAILAPFGDPAVLGLGEFLEFNSAACRMRAAFGADLVAVRARHDGQDRQGSEDLALPCSASRSS